MLKVLVWARTATSIVGEWWALMSGALAIPFAFLALILSRPAAFWFAVLSYMALWVLVFRMGHRIYQLEKRSGHAERMKGIQAKGISTKRPPIL